VKGGKKMARISKGKTATSIKIEKNEIPSRTLSLAYTYAGGEGEVAGLRRLANWWARLGKNRLAQALAQLADDLEQGVAMGVISPGDTVYCAV
jgi:hypothetical protein